MKNSVISIIACLLFLSCSDSIQEDINLKPTDEFNKLNVNFSLANASTPIAIVAAELKSDQHDNIQFTMTLDGEMASHTLDHIQQGQWTLVVKAYDNVSQLPANLRFTGEQILDVVAGQLTNVAINLHPTSGALEFTVAWGSAATLQLDINVLGDDASVTDYQYLLEREGFKSLSGVLSASTAVSNHLVFDVRDIQHGIWKLTVTAVTNTSSPVATGLSDIELMTGVVAIANVTYPINPFSLEIIASYQTQSGNSNKVYIGDEKLRQFLIGNQNFTDLREPYVLRSEAETVQFLELHKQDFFYYDKSLNSYLNLDVLASFVNLIELETSGWIIPKLDFQNHDKLKHVSLREIEADYADFSGAPNMLAIDLYNVSINWIDIDELVNMESLEVDGDGEGQCCIIANKEIGPPDQYGHKVGSIYVDESMFGKYDVDESLFVDSSYDTDSVKVKIPDNDGKRILLSADFHILKDNYVLQSELDDPLDLLIGDIYGGGPKGKGGPSFFDTYRPVESLEVIKLLTNLESLILIDQKFTEIDVSNNPEIWGLAIIQCQFFTEIDVTNNTKLGSNVGPQKSIKWDPLKSRNKGIIESSAYLILNNNYSLTTVLMDTQTYMTEVEISDNKSLTNLDLSKIPNLEEIYGYDNSLTSLNLNGLSNLTYLEISNNNLVNLDLSDHTNLSTLYVSENDLQPTLDITPISASINSIYTTSNALLDTIFYKTGQDTLSINKDAHTVFKLVSPAKQKGGN